MKNSLLLESLSDVVRNKVTLWGTQCKLSDQVSHTYRDKHYIVANIQCESGTKRLQQWEEYRQVVKPRIYIKPEYDKHSYKIVYALNG